MQRVPLVLVINNKCSDVHRILVEEQATTEFLTARSSSTQVYYTDSQNKYF